MKKRQKNRTESAIKKIEDRFELGKEILKQCGSTSPHGLITELAEQ